MIGKFATATASVLTLLGLMILLGPQGFAQAAPAPATPAPGAQQPASPVPANGQEPADEGSTSRKVKPHDYKNWTFNVGAGANLGSGTTKTYVRGGGFEGMVGAARNANKYLGLRADFIYADLPLRDSAQQLAQATGATSYVLGLTLGPVINLPVTKLWGGYVVLGPGFLHRAGSLDGSTAVPGSGCNGFWTWWGACPNVSIPLSGSFVNSSQNEFAYDFGGGVTRKFPSGAEMYLEGRIMHGSHNNISTDFRPITLGFRW
jgi:hypothetical protein